MVNIQYIDMDDKSDLYRAPNQEEQDGMQMSGRLTSQQHWDKLKVLETTEHDIILTGYPRCGNTWMLEILYLLQSGGDVTGMRTRHMSLRHLFIDLIVPQVAEPEIGYTRAQRMLGQPRLLKTHARAWQLRKPIEDGRAKIIVVIRNPKDALVSYFQFHRDNKAFAGKFNVTFDHFIKMALAKQIMFGDWLNFYLSYWKEKDRKNIHFVVYEHAMKDLRSTIKDLADFIGVPYNNDTIELIYENTKFGEMKSRPSIYAPRMKGNFIREGKVGGWKSVFTVAQSDAIDGMYAKAIKENQLPVIYSLNDSRL